MADVRFVLWTPFFRTQKPPNVEPEAAPVANQKEKKQEAASNDEADKEKSESRPMTDKSGN